MGTSDLAKRLKELRGLRGMSQEYLAEESKVSLRTIQRIENEESSPTGETIKRIALALDVELNELMGSGSLDETSDLKGTIIFLKKQLAKTDVKSEVKIFESFIKLLNNLKEKDLTPEQVDGIESYIQYLELDKIPSFSNEMFKQKLNKFRKYLKTKLRFVPNRYYTEIGVSFTIAFVTGIVVTNGVGVEIILLGLTIVALCVFQDFRIKKQGRSLSF
ncbi:MAG: hypothetical protein BM557_08065 [Flavobacterium sp. MedPE-SWcel]|uniref:helix-turn-helix domain-containing protein n=1 Tax=uncultured Flavobacterium sp. TaxID=165435 RepID=UPI000913ABE2|nr:helix-turn-helix transcriptional regulator [uncultured Flavobacterium sp.]OIQ17636.1 MAG: hypothetical protein BM557_08065 [Flavobacterium sp. MedPE-SWcel]